MHRYGIETEADIEKTIEYYEKATENGNVNAMYSLAQMYDYGVVVEKDIDKAVEFYEKAADNGDLRAEIRLEILKGNLE